ncbi:MAG: hypothetical protein NUV75_12755 [Gallionella sp.]|nr:hypothetical protein [Gallionella sp.]
MNAPVHAKAYNLPLRSKLLDWLEASPQKVASPQQWQWIVQDANKAAIAPPVKSKDVALHFLNDRSTPAKEQIRVLQVSSALKQAMTASKIPLFGW